MPVYQVFIDRRRVKNCDKLNFSGPWDIANQLPEHSYFAFSCPTKPENERDVQVLESSSNYRKVLVGGN